MYKAVVIDDEPWVIKTLVDSVRWSNHGFEVAGTSSDSREGLELIRSVRPDLVFIDIRMPEMNGLECMKQAKAMQLNAQFIVVSGFAEFSYAQKSLQLGAIGYCLKPIDEDEIEALLKKVKDELDSRQSKETPPLIERIMDDSAGSGEWITAYLSGKGLAFGHDQALRVVCCLGGEAPPDLSGCLHAVLYQGYRKVIVLVREDTPTAVYEYFAGSRKETCKGIGISAPVFRLDQLKSAIEEAELAGHHYFLTGRPSIWQAADENETDYSELREIYPALQRQDMAELNRLYELCQNRLTSGRYPLKYALLLYHTVMTAIINSDYGEDTSYLIHDYELLIERYQVVEEMVKDLKRMTVAYLGNMFSGPSVAIRSDSFKAILQYINEHHQQEITLQKLSDSFFINPNYISQLFIKHLGKPFTAYLAELRVRSACHKLKSGNQTVQEIAAAVGIPDPYYFSKIFRKVTGMSPREYRRTSG